MGYMGIMPGCIGGGPPPVWITVFSTVLVMVVFFLRLHQTVQQMPMQMRMHAPIIMAPMPAEPFYALPELTSLYIILLHCGAVML